MKRQTNTITTTDGITVEVLTEIEAKAAGHIPVTTPYTDSERPILNAAIRTMGRDKAVLVRIPPLSERTGERFELWRRGAK